MSKTAIVENGYLPGVRFKQSWWYCHRLRSQIDHANDVAAVTFASSNFSQRFDLSRFQHGKPPVSAGQDQLQISRWKYANLSESFHAEKDLCLTDWQWYQFKAPRIHKGYSDLISISPTQSVRCFLKSFHHNTQSTIQY